MAWLRALATYAGRIAAAAGLTLLFIWPLTKFDVSPPIKAQTMSRDLIRSQTPYWEIDAPDWRKQKMPAGVWIGSLLEGQRHNGKGHAAYFLGEKREKGWWYYFPVVALYKVPIGHLAVMALALASFVWRRPRLAEVPLWIAAACFWALLIKANINIGWRHALVGYGLLLIVATRAVAGPRPGRDGLSRVRVGIALGALALSALHVTWWHPNYIPYVNFPREKVYLDISDSNVDWGQSARQVGKWLEKNRDELPQPIYYSGFGPPQPVQRYVKDVQQVGRELPREGTLIISPVNVAGPYRGNEHFAPLQAAEPIAVIAETMLVFDLSRVPR